MTQVLITLLYTQSLMTSVIYIIHVAIIVTGSIARSATRRYLIYSEADFEVFRPEGATR